VQLRRNGRTGISKVGGLGCLFAQVTVLGAGGLDGSGSDDQSRSSSIVPHRITGRHS